MLRATLLISFLALKSHGQTALTGALQGTVTDEQGGAIPNVAIELSSESSGYSGTQTADATGSFRFLRLIPGSDYRVTATSSSAFDPWRAHSVSILSGDVSSLNIVLRLGKQSEAVNIEAVVTGISTDSAELATPINSRALNTLPTNGRVITRFALLDSRVRNANALGGDGSNQYRLAINANTFRDSQHRLDGNTNYDTLFNNIPLQRVPLSAVQEFRVLTNQFTAEHGSTSSGLTITTTKTGSDALHGELFFLVRPSGMQARPPLANLRIPNQLLQEGASVGGPIAKNQTYFFGSYERTDQERGSFISSGQRGFYLGKYTDDLSMVKIDHRWSDTHWLTLRVNGHRDTNTNPNDRVGGLVQPSAANLSVTQAIGVQVTDTKTWGSLVNEVRAGYVNAVPSSSSPQVAGLVVTRPGYSTEGSATYSSNRAEVYQVADQISWQQGTHVLKAGGDFIRRKVRDKQFDVLGAYTFPGGAPTADSQPTLYTQRFGVADLSYGQTQWAGFVQDTWRAHPRLTLNLGIRYDYQSLLDDYNNLGPRASFVYDPKGDGSTIIRGGFGLFYDQPFFHGLTQRFLLNAPNAPFSTYSIAPGSAAFPQYPFSYPPTTPPPGLTLAPRNVVIRGDKLLSPYTSQFTLGFQRQLPDNWILSADVTRTLTVKQFLHYDLNAASQFVRAQAGQMRTVAEADRTRPLYDSARGVSIYQGVAIRELRMTTNGNTANYHALTVNLSRRFGDRYFAGVSYNWGSAMNSITDDHLGANPQEWSDVQRAERAASDFLQRRRFVVNGGVRLPWAFHVSGVFIAASALPVNALTGVDNNGDGLVRDRPAGFGRNAFAGTPQRQLDLSLSRQVTLTERIRMELRADGYNLLNNQNYYVFNTVYGNGAAPAATFLKPVGGVANVDPARQFTFGAKLQF
ncbi:MAG TPA: TonB-dependent receptor [Bryobacteraceae bacterium]|nr:TonB-dependent receptor [Bryobacteraceae bacterium]